jgi:hypothetical protein
VDTLVKEKGILIAEKENTLKSKQSELDPA